MPRRTYLKTMLVGSACAIALTTGGMAAAQTRDFDVPAGDLSVALDTYARQSGIQIIYRIADVTGVHTQGAKGALSTDEALAQLLEGTRFKVRRDPSGAIAIADASAPQSGSAAGDGADAGTVQALVVTAQKREENIQDVPIAMSAFTQEDLTRSQVAGGPDLMTQVPNFTFTKTNFSGYSIQIRGIGTQAISATTDAAVAVAFNNTPFLRSHFFEQEFYDLERAEVLRGPQGTLYGRNATAGVVNLISAKPKFHFEAKASADVGNYNATRLEGMLNLPLVEDKAALRLAGAWTKRDGYDTNQITGNRIDGRDLWSTRVTLRLDPIERLQMNFIWEHFKEDDDRLRSGKQTCKTAHPPLEVDGIPLSYGNMGNGVQIAERYLDQGCVPTSLYSSDAFQVPDGKTLAYYLPFVQLGAPIQGTGESHYDVYASAVQSHDLRTIESQVDPIYRSSSDTMELNVDFELTPSLTLTSQTGYSRDFLWSMEDYNRFNTNPGAFIYCDPTAAALSDDCPFYPNGNSNGQLLPDPNGHATYTEVAGPDLVGKPCDLNENSTDCILNGIFCDPQIGCSDRLVVEDLSEERSRQFSQEFRLASNFEGALNFSVGANVLRYKTVENYFVFINTLTLMAATAPVGGDGGVERPWVPGVSDNHQCLIQGLNGGFEYVDPLAPHNPQFSTCAYIDPNPLTSLNNQGHNYFLSQNPYKLQSYALFGEIYYKIAENLKFTAGLRWTIDKKHFVDIPSELLIPGYGYPVTAIVKQHWSQPTGRLVVDWTPNLSITDQTLVYASYVHGYKAGGANPPGAALLINRGADIPLPVHPLTFDPEFVNAYELGTKNTFPGGTLTLNANAFYYDYTGYQISQIVDRSAINSNFDAKVWGLELESEWRPLENLRLGLKIGYEDTRIANGMGAVDLMDRTGGRQDWLVVKPFVTQASNCILPKYVVAALLYEQESGSSPSQNVSNACSHAYSDAVDPWSGYAHTDPVTGLPYVPNPSANWDGGPLLPNYKGFNPLTAPNGGAGFSKDLGGNSLPNAPHWTATLTADYTVPLVNDWLLTLHGDFYQQSEAWARVFNMPGYDKLKAYNNINLAAIFTNQDAGWTVMAYAKNVLDKDNITGAFLNSDDTGLTTNVFLNEPRLYGLRVTKAWMDSPWWTAHTHRSGAPYPFHVEIEGYHGPYSDRHEPFTTPDMELYSPDFRFPLKKQNDLGWGSGGGVKFTWTPAPSGWRLAAGVRYGRSAESTQSHERQSLGMWCSGSYCFNSATGEITHDGAELFEYRQFGNKYNYNDQLIRNEEDHSVLDFTLGKDVGLGARTTRITASELSFGLRYARLRSASDAVLHGRPDFYANPNDPAKYPMHSHQFTGQIEGAREFEGAGPEVNWDVSAWLFGDPLASGQIGVEAGLSGGVLFGRQDARLDGLERGSYRTPLYGFDITPPYERSFHYDRSKSVSVPFANANVGLSYTLGGLKVSGGYRFERYFKAVDGGIAERKTYDRDIKGGYVKIAVGFGG